MFGISRMIRALLHSELRWASVKKDFKLPNLKYCNNINHKYDLLPLILREKDYWRQNKNIFCLFTYGGLFTFLQKKDDSESELTTIIKRGILLWQQGDMKKSELMFHIALKLAQEQQNDDGILYIMDSLANLAYESNQPDKAEYLFLTVLKNLVGAGVAYDDLRIIHISLKLAQIYEKTGETSKAEIGYKFCFDKLEKKVKDGAENIDTTMLFIATLETYAHFALEQKRHEEAQQLLIKACSLLLSTKEPLDRHVVLLFNNLGTVGFYQNYLDTAQKCFEAALTLSEKVSAGEDLAPVYLNLAYLYMKKNMLIEAKRACSNAMDTARMYKSKDLTDRATECLETLRKYETAKVESISNDNNCVK